MKVRMQTDERLGVGFRQIIGETYRLEGVIHIHKLFCIAPWLLQRHVLPPLDRAPNKLHSFRLLRMRQTPSGCAHR